MPVRRITQFLERTLPIAVLIVAVVGAPITIFSPQGLPPPRELRESSPTSRRRMPTSGGKSEALRGKVARLRDDPTAVERIARDNLGLVRQSEVVFQFSR